MNLMIGGMKGLCLIWLYFGVGVTMLLAQDRKYDVALSAGFYQSPRYTHAVAKPFLAADFDYHLGKRWIISTGFLSGQFAYFEDWRSNMFSYDEYTNAKGYDAHIRFTASYSILRTNRFSVQVGSGLGLFTQRLKYAYREPASGGSPRGNETPTNNGIKSFTAEESFSISELPIKVEGFYWLGARIGLGLSAGTYLHFGRSLTGTYVGPQLRVRL